MEIKEGLGLAEEVKLIHVNMGTIIHRYYVIETCSKMLSRRGSVTTWGAQNHR